MTVVRLVWQRVNLSSIQHYQFPMDSHKGCRHGKTKIFGGPFLLVHVHVEGGKFSWPVASVPSSHQYRHLSCADLLAGTDDNSYLFLRRCLQCFSIASYVGIKISSVHGHNPERSTWLLFLQMVVVESYWGKQHSQLIHKGIHKNIKNESN